MTSSTLSDFRKHFPATSNGIFTNVAQRGLIPLPVHDSITNYLTSRTDLSWNKEESFSMVEDTRSTFASFINATPSEIAFTKNVSEGINLIAGGSLLESRRQGHPMSRSRTSRQCFPLV